jgi:hypothetical protein
MKPVIRRSGITANQIKSCPNGAIFVWCNNRSTDYAKKIAERIGRDDIKIVPPDWLCVENIAGRSFSGIVVDHSAQLNSSQFDCLCMSRIESKCD